MRRPSRVLRVVVAKVGGALLVLWGAVTLAFLALRLVPGDPVDVILGPLAQVDEEGRQAIRERLGLTGSALEQYLGYLGRLLAGDFGDSYQQGRPVVDVILGQAGSTAALAGSALALALVLALLGAVLARRGAARLAVEALELLAVAAPTFWIGLVLLAVFSYQLRWFPLIGGDELVRLVLPAVTLALPLAGVLGPVIRSGLDRADDEPFMASVVARGASPLRISLRHGLRHAATGSFAVAGYLVGTVLGGAVLVETVFARPGLGRVTLDAITGRDIPVVMGVVLLLGAIFATVNLVVDGLSLLVDARLRQATASGEERP